MKVRVASLAGEIEIPGRLLNDPTTLKFIETLEKRGGIDRSLAQHYALQILAHTSGEFAERLGRELGTRIQRIMDLRKQLKHSYDEVIEHFKRGAGVGPLPPNLQPPAFRRLFIEMANEVRKLQDLRVDQAAKTNPPKLPASAPAAVKPAPVTRPALSGRAGELQDRLDNFLRINEPTLRHHPLSAQLLDEADAVRRLLTSGKVDEAASALDNLRSRVRIAETQAHQVAPVGTGRAQRAEAAETPGLSPSYGRTPLPSIEGLRTAPDMLPDAPGLPLDRISFERAVPESAVDLRRQWDIIMSGDRSKAGLDYEAWQKHRLAAEAPVGRPGRAPDVGRTEITIEGMFGPFTPHKMQQLWTDFVDLRGVTLVVPGLSPEARLQLRQLAQLAEDLTGQQMSVRVIETAP